VLASLAVMFLSCAMPQAHAQSLADGLAGFGAESDEPIQIEADELEVRDAEKLAVFTGNVNVQQGRATLKAVQLYVYYEGETTATQSSADGTGANQRLKRLEARGPVVVSADDQTATGDDAVFDVASDIVTMTGNVVLTQGGNVVRGDRLIINLATRQSRVVSEGRSSGGRVQGLFLPGSGTPGQ